MTKTWFVFNRAALGVVGQFPDSRSDRLMAVYQHVRAQAISHRVDTVCRALNVAIDACNWSSYEFATVAMIFLSPSHQRVAEVTTHSGDCLASTLLEGLERRAMNREVMETLIRRGSLLHAPPFKPFAL